MRSYDLVVIGSGPAGEKAAAQAAYFGKSVAVVEARPEPGGVCAHTGTIPSKTLRESSLYLSGVRSRGLYGVNYFIKRDISVQDFMFRRHRVVSREVERIHQNLNRHRIDFIHGRATLVDKNTVQIGKEKIGARFILIATGSRPFHAPYLDFTDPNIFDSDSILNIDVMPRSLCIIGAGVIGCEYATIFAALGIRVVLVDPGAEILAFLDDEMTTLLQEQMQKLGVHVLLREKVSQVMRSERTQKVSLESGNDFEVESVLFAAGRQGNTDSMGLEALGIVPNKRGQLQVNEHYQTSVPTIYAAGDVIGFPALASSSMEQGRVAACHAFDIRYKKSMSQHIPYGIYTIPEVSSVGLSEEQCKEQGLPYAVGRARYAANTRGQIIGDEDGLLKLIFDPKTLHLLGVHIIGDRASELIHIGQMCLTLGGTIDTLIQTVFNYPTLSETYKYAAYDGLGHLSKQVQREGVLALSEAEAAAEVEA